MNNETASSFISNTSGLLGHCDTLENTAQILALLEPINLSEGMSRDAQYGLFLIIEMLIQSLRQVSDELKTQVP